MPFDLKILIAAEVSDSPSYNKLLLMISIDPDELIPFEGKAPVFLMAIA